MTKHIRLEDPMKLNQKPACFDSLQQWRAWLDAYMVCSPRYRPAARYCADCTPEYKQEMIQAGRCSHTEIEFKTYKKSFTFQGVVFQEKETIGQVPQDMKARAATRIRNAQLRGRGY